MFCYSVAIRIYKMHNIYESVGFGLYYRIFDLTSRLWVLAGTSLLFLVGALCLYYVTKGYEETIEDSGKMCSAIRAFS